MNRRIHTFGWLMVLAALLLMVWFIQGALVHAQTAIIAPNGGITYVYPSTSPYSPAVIIPPTGPISYAYPAPGGATVVLPPVYTPAPSTYGGYSYGR